MGNTGWDDYVKHWKDNNPGLKYVGDEWASFSSHLEEIRSRWLAPYITKEDVVYEIGCGAGRTAAVLLEYCKELIGIDISKLMLKLAEKRIGTDRTKFILCDGVTLPPAKADVVFSYDTFYHLEPYDIYNYLVQIPTAVLQGNKKKLCIIHHSDILSDIGFANFVKRYRTVLKGKRNFLHPSVMTQEIMQKFFDYLGYEVLLKDTETLPRDCVWIVRSSC